MLVHPAHHANPGQGKLVRHVNGLCQRDDLRVLQHSRQEGVLHRVRAIGDLQRMRSRRLREERLRRQSSRQQTQDGKPVSF
jgi:hypothetical protein